MAEVENDVYVRKDVFDARMDRLEILIEKNGTEIKAYIDNSVNSLRNELKGEIQQVRTETNAAISGVKGEIQQVRTDLTNEIQQNKLEIQQVRSGLTGEIQGLKTEIRVLEGKVDNAIHVVYWGIGGFAVILAAAIFVPLIIGFLKQIFKPSITLEDVERLLDSRLRAGEAFAEQRGE
ncbi:MAG: hypothetical protein IJ859_10485 [Synergistaceae bacterium]|nr:hypothetical protein [Synergistaceae bacterium]